jgi:histidyl-tRNA synthetase
MMAADTMEALGIERGEYVVKVNNRKILDGILEAIGLSAADNGTKRFQVLRAMDKYDRLGEEGVRLLLGTGRKDESGDFTAGAELPTDAIDELILLLGLQQVGEFVDSNTEYLGLLKERKFQINTTYRAGIDELQEMTNIFSSGGFASDRIRVDTSVVRGLEYYTGPVFECELLMETKDENGKPVRFGSVGGGGRYDDLVARFTGQQVPATGFSIGVSRLYSALEHLKKNKASDTLAPVVVTVMDKERQGDYWKLVQTLRQAGIRAEMYIGTSNMQKQMKYADKRNAPLVIIQGADEKAKGEVQIKDLRRGSELASEIESREEYASQRLAQFSVPEAEMVAAVKKALQS